MIIILSNVLFSQTQLSNALNQFKLTLSMILECKYLFENEFLNPSLQFLSVGFQYPKTLTLTQIRV